jgi:ABC-type lipoprotein export system ATPase subunit
MFGPVLPDGEVLYCTQVTTPVQAGPATTRQQVLEAILGKPPGCQHFCVDLHVHTPASRDHRWPAGTQPRDVLLALAAAQVDLFAVTDHFSGEWIDALRTARQALRRDTRYTGQIPVMLPGVEVATGGVHLTVIFPEDRTTDQVHHFLSKLDVSPATWGDPTQTVAMSPVQVVREAHDLGALVVGAHCNSNSGVIRSLGGLGRLQLLEVLDLLECSAAQLPASYEKTIRYVHNDLGLRRLAVVLSSDAHSGDELGGTSFIKMDAPSFSGLLQLVHEPALRGAFHRPAMEQSFVLGINVTPVRADSRCIYRHVQLRFNPDLNVIIGGRGSGKSALLDTLRYGLDDPPKTSTLREGEGGHYDRIRGMYSEGDIVQVFVQQGQDLYCCERPVSVQAGPRHSPLHAPLPTRIYKLIEREFVQVETLPGPGFEILSQNEIMEVITQRSNLMEFLDEYEPDIHRHKQEIAARLNDCRQLALAIVQARDHARHVRELTTRRDENVQRVAEYNAILDSAVFALFDRVQAERPAVQRIRENLLGAVTQAREYYVSVQTVLNAVEELAPALPHGTPEEGSLQAVAAAYAVFAAEVRTFTERTIATAGVATTAVGSWDTRFEAARMAYTTWLREQGKDGLEELAQQKGRLETEVAGFELKIEEHATEAARRPALEAEFLSQLTHLEQQWAALRAARQTVIDRINTDLSGRVRVELEREGDSAILEDSLSQLLKGQRVPAAVLTEVAGTLTPAQLYRDILSENLDALRAAGASGAAALKILALAEHTTVFDLPLLEKPDVPQIYLIKGGGVEAPLSALSHGERVSAILPMLMLDKALPLIIDQPEDDVDHAFITENVVRAIRDAKGRRQIITVTHNPNVPVLGDADLVVKVERVEAEQSCRVLSARGLEHAERMRHLELLEGGAEAFERRRRKYLGRQR